MAGTLNYVTADEIEKIKNEKLTDCFVAELDYRDINNEKDYLNKMGEIFRFPVFEGQAGHSWDGYFDWMTDLSWGYDEEWMDKTRNGYNLIIYNCSKNGYAKRFDKLLRDIIDSFVYDILPWWNKDVESCVVEGKPKSFNVYLVI